MTKTSKLRGAAKLAVERKAAREAAEQVTKNNAEDVRSRPKPIQESHSGMDIKGASVPNQASTGTGERKNGRRKIGKTDKQEWWNNLSTETKTDAMKRLAAHITVKGTHTVVSKTPNIWVGGRSISSCQFLWAFTKGVFPAPNVRLLQHCDEFNCCAPEHRLPITFGRSIQKGVEGATEADWTNAEQLLTSNSRLENGHRIWTGSIDEYGYGHQKWRDKCFGAHVLAFLTKHRGNILIPKGYQVLHGPGCPRACIDPNHLSCGTPVQNAADKRRDGTATVGEKHYQAKITQQIADAVRATKGQGTQKERGAKFGLTPKHVAAIDTNRIWVTDESQRRKKPRPTKKPNVSKEDYTRWIQRIKARCKLVPVDPDDPIACISAFHWIYEGYKDRGGYGQISLQNAPRKTHKAALEARLQRSLDPKEMSRHLCGRGKRRDCCNPDHLALSQLVG